jgi:hypothetical protein
LLLKDNEGVFSSSQKIFTPSYQMLRHMHGVLNVDEKNN